MTAPQIGPAQIEPAQTQAAQTQAAPRRPVRIANSSGFYGDRAAAAREMVEGGPIDVLTGDYLAELTMLILWKAQQKDPSMGYARTVLTQLEHVLGTCLDRGIKIVNNAGGLNPAGLAREFGALAGRLGLHPAIAYVTGDDLLPRLDSLVAGGQALAHLDTGQPLAGAGGKPVTANAYLGGWGITEALAAGADIVVCPRVTDASLVTGPAAWWHGWRREDFGPLAGAVVAGHVIECGPQATGGNYSFLDEIRDRRYPGFPIAEVAADGSSVITKHPGTGGLVSPGTVTAQLLYEIAGPGYANPDVVAHFDTIRLEQDGPDRVRISGTRGSPPPATAKVAINFLGGYRNTMTLVLTGLDIEEKAVWAGRSCLPSWAAATSSPTSMSGCCASTGPTRPRTSRPPRTCGSRSRTPTRARWAAASPTRRWSWPSAGTRASTPRPRRRRRARTASTGPRSCPPTRCRTRRCFRTARPYR